MALLALPVTGDINESHRRNPEFLHVCGVQKDDPSAHPDSPVAIIEPVNSGVELIMATEGLENKVVLWDFELFKGSSRKQGFPPGSISGPFLRTVREIEPSSFARPFVKPIESGNNLFD